MTRMQRKIRKAQALKLALLGLLALILGVLLL